jgi:hypothetical protein
LLSQHTTSRIETLPRGATILNSLRHTETLVSQEASERVVKLLTGDAANAAARRWITCTVTARRFAHR